MSFELLRKTNSGLAAFLRAVLIIVFSFLVVTVLWGVFSRYILGAQASWSEELARLLMVWLGLLGAALAFKEDQHLGLDIIVRQWPLEVQHWGRIFVSLAVLAFGSFVMLYGGSQLVWQRFESGQTLPAMGIAKAWFYLAVPLCGALVSMFSIEAIILAWSGKSELKEGAE